MVRLLVTAESALEEFSEPAVRTHSLLFHVTELVYKVANHSHRNKPKKWIVKPYFGKSTVQERPMGVRRP